jgi:hypothetical protein
MDNMDTSTIAKQPIRQPGGKYDRVNAVLPRELYSELDRVAQQLDRPLSWIARVALREWLDRHHPTTQA